MHNKMHAQCAPCGQLQRAHWTLVGGLPMCVTVNLQPVLCLETESSKRHAQLPICSFSRNCPLMKMVSGISQDILNFKNFLLLWILWTLLYHTSPVTLSLTTYVRCCDFDKTHFFVEKNEHIRNTLCMAVLSLISLIYKWFFPRSCWVAKLKPLWIGRWMDMIKRYS